MRSIDFSTLNKGAPRVRPIAAVAPPPPVPAPIPTPPTPTPPKK